MASDESQTTPPENVPSAPAEDGSPLSSFQRRLEGKPMLIYGTLIAGAMALLFLLLVVWLSTRDSGSKVILCLDTSVAEAESAIIGGSVRRADVLLDAENPVEGLTAIQLQLESGECRKLPEGADNRAELLQVLGLIELSNQQGEGSIRVEYQRETIPPNLLVTSTPIPSVTPPTVEASPLVPSPVLPTSTRTPTTFPPTATPSPSPSPTSPPTTRPEPTRVPTERTAPTGAATP